MTRDVADAVASIARSKGRIVASAKGEYRTWISPNGAEIWLHYPKREQAEAKPFDPIDDLQGMTVFQRGASAVVMRIQHTMSWENPLDGVCIADLPALRGNARGMPFVFEQVGFGLDPAPCPFTARVQLCGLGHRVWAYATEADLLRALPSNRLISRGAIAAMEPDEVDDVGLIYRTKPGALWLVTGVILKSIKLRNALAGGDYYWLLVETDRGDIDIVVNPNEIDGDISTGHTVQAVVSMVGRVLDRLEDA
jgi:hypothetical protein